MQDSPFSRITRTSRRLNLALFGVLPIALVLISAILWSWQRLIKQEEEKLLLDFTVFMGYIEAEERFLQGFRTQNALLQGPPSSPDVSWHETPPSERQGTAFYEGRRPLFSTPFTVSCLSADCTRDRAQLSAMGSYLSAYYSTYWPTTYYLVNASDSVSISVPALDMPSSFRPLSQSTYLTSVDAIREQIELNHIVEQRLIDLHAPADLHERTQVQWFTAPASPNRIIGLLPAVPSGVWRAEAGSPPDVYIATLLHRDRINIFDRILPSGLYDEFWLTRNDAGLLLGEGPLPDAQERAALRRTAGVQGHRRLGRMDRLLPRRLPRLLPGQSVAAGQRRAAAAAEHRRRPRLWPLVQPPRAAARAERSATSSKAKPSAAP